MFAGRGMVFPGRWATDTDLREREAQEDAATCTHGENARDCDTCAHDLAARPPAGPLPTTTTTRTTP